MSLENVTPVLTLSEGATLKAPKLPTTLVADTKQTFVVLAEDGKTMGSYEVTVHLDETLKGKDAQIKGSDLKLQDASILKDIEILKCTEEPTADGADITLLVGSGVDITRLYVTGVIPFGAKDDTGHSEWRYEGRSERLEYNYSRIGRRNRYQNLSDQSGEKACGGNRFIPGGDRRRDL